MRRLEQFQRRVREGVSVEEAQDFARYLRVSCIGKLMEENPPESEKLCRVFDYDGGKLLSEARSLEMACCAFWAGKTFSSEGTASGANKSDLEAIDAKLALLTERLAEVESVKRKRDGKPMLRVVKQKDKAA
jgi:hypothetical protein